MPDLKNIRGHLLDLIAAAVSELVTDKVSKNACSRAISAIRVYDAGFKSLQTLRNETMGMLCDGDAPEDIDDCLEQALTYFMHDPFGLDDVQGCLDVLEEAFDRAWHVSRGLDYTAST